VTWDEFFAYVAPQCPGAPEPLLTQYVRAAAIEFCRRTGCWTRTLDPLTVVAGQTAIALPLDEGQEVARLQCVMVGELEYTVRDRKNALRAQRRNWSGREAWTDDRQELQLYPWPDVGTVVTLDVTLKPSEDAEGLDDDVGLQHVRAIAAGALSHLLDLSNTAWRDSSKALTEAGRFEDAIGRAAFNEMRGHGSRLTRNGPPTF
jgi:hypothetical protein